MKHTNSIKESEEKQVEIWESSKRRMSRMNTLITKVPLSKFLTSPLDIPTMCFNLPTLNQSLLIET